MAILKTIYYQLTRESDYEDLGHDYFEKLNPKRTANRLIKRLEGLGYTITKMEQPQPDLSQAIAA